MKIFNWVHRKINGQHIHAGESEQEDFGSVSFNYWQNGLLCIGTLGGDDQKRVHPEQEEKEDEHIHGHAQYAHGGHEIQGKDEAKDEDVEELKNEPVVAVEAEAKADITAAEVEMFKKSLAKMLGLEAENNNHLKENFEAEAGCPSNQSFPLGEFLEIPVNPIAINGASEATKKKKKQKKNSSLGTILFSKKQQAVTDEQSNGVKALTAPSAKNSDASVVDKILNWKKKRSFSSSSAPPETLLPSKFSKFKNMLKEKGTRALKKGGRKDEMAKSGPLIGRNKYTAPFSSSCLSDTYTYTYPVQERNGNIAGHEEEYISLSRDHSLGRMQEYWIKTNSEFVVLEL